MWACEGRPTGHQKSTQGNSQRYSGGWKEECVLEKVKLETGGADGEGGGGDKMDNKTMQLYDSEI